MAYVSECFYVHLPATTSFANKIWNAFRLVKNWEADKNIKGQPAWSAEAAEWFGNRLNEAIHAYNRAFDKYRISDALMIVYRLFWDDFASWYLEAVKPDFDKPVDLTTLNKTLEFFDHLMRLIHPFMPFITEEIWQMIKERDAGISIMVSEMPEAGKVSSRSLEDFENARMLISTVRNIRKENNLPPRESLQLFINAQSIDEEQKFQNLVKRLANISDIKQTSSKPAYSLSFMIGTSEYYLLIGDRIDVESELSRLEADLKYNKGFLDSVMSKLNNANFINNAPEKVVEREKKKKSDVERKINSLIERINELKDRK